MRSLLQLFIRNGGFVIFVLLEVFSFYLVINNNERSKSIFSHTSGVIGGNILGVRQQIARYFRLTERVDSLQKENAELRSRLLNTQMVRVPYRDTFFSVHIDSLHGRVLRPEFKFIAAEAIGNSINSNSNWLTLNRGESDSVTTGCGVIARDGLVGIVRHTNDKFAIVMSLLHRQTRISASIKRAGYFGSLVWEGGNPEYMTLNDIPKHVPVEIGDSVVTSGYSLIFPKNIMIGAISSKDIPRGSNFYALKVKLSHTMAKTTDVYVVKNIFYNQLDSLQQKAKDE